jgi:hypothetical protein
MKKLLIIFSLLAIASQSNAQTVTGGDMETWKTYTSAATSLVRPDGWSTSDSLISYIKLLGLKSYTGRVTKSSTVKNGGSYSAMMVSATTDSLPTLLANANIKFDLTSVLAGDYSKVTYVGGTNVSSRILSANAYTRYSSTTADTGTMIVTAFKNGYGVGGTDSIVGTGSQNVTGSSAFVKQTVSISYVNTTVVPDRIVISFAVSKKTIPVVGSTMYVDDVTLTGTTGIETPIVNDQNVSVFPNPSSNLLHISADINDMLVVRFYNSLGQLVLAQDIDKVADINVSQFANGNYIYVLSSKAGNKYYSAIFTKQ